MIYDEDAVLRPPRLLIGMTLVFWGGLVGQPVVGLICAVLLEGRNWTRLRWELMPRGFIRAWHLTVLLMVVAAALSWLDGIDSLGFFRFFRWLPVLLLPLALAQQFSREGRMPVNTFSYFARRKMAGLLRQGRRVRVALIDFGYPFICLTLLGAAMGMEHDTPWFFPGAVVIAAIGLWSSRKKSERRALAWVSALGVAAVVGFGGQLGLLALRDFVMSQRFGGEGNEMSGMGPNHVSTQIGSLGDLKQSPEILWRLKPISGRVPPLLRMATYNSYYRGFWRYGFHPDGTGWESDFRDMPSFGAGTFGEGRVVRREDVGQPLDERLPQVNLRGGVSYRSMLPIPDGVRTFYGLQARELDHNSLGTVRIAPEYPVADMRILWDEKRNIEANPWAPDLVVPVVEHDVLADIVAELGLDTGTTAERVAKLRVWFVREFTYSRYLGINQPKESVTGLTALNRFLTDHRKGHCEYFATATTLLMRQTGVPSRYAVGFSIVEEDPKRKEWVARGTHAHAWARVWFAEEGRWKDVDLTPPQWGRVEKPASRPQQALLDAWQRLREDLLIWRSQPGNLSRVTAGVAAVGVLLTGWMVCRLAGARQLTRKMIISEKRSPSASSPLLDLEPLAAKWLGPRPESQPLAPWLGGLPQTLPGLHPPLEEALALHRRARFDPLGLKAAESLRLIALAAELRKILKRPPRKPA